MKTSFEPSIKFSDEEKAIDIRPEEEIGQQQMRAQIAILSCKIVSTSIINAVIKIVSVIYIVNIFSSSSSSSQTVIWFSILQNIKFE